MSSSLSSIILCLLLLILASVTKATPLYLDTNSTVGGGVPNNTNSTLGGGLPNNTNSTTGGALLNNTISIAGGGLPNTSEPTFVSIEGVKEF